VEVVKLGKEAKKGVTVQLSEDVVLTLQRLAAQQRVSVSKLGGEFLEAGLKIGGEKAAEMLLLPKLEAAMRLELSHFAGRVASLLSRNTIEAGVTRRLLRGFLAVQAGADVAARAEERARRETVIELRNKHGEASVLARELGRELTEPVDVVTASLKGE
jgi:hypothetical protein